MCRMVNIIIWAHPNTNKLNILEYYDITFTTRLRITNTYSNILMVLRVWAFARKLFSRRMPKTISCASNRWTLCRIYIYIHVSLELLLRKMKRLQGKFCRQRKINYRWMLFSYMKWQKLVAHVQQYSTDNWLILWEVIQGVQLHKRLLIELKFRVKRIMNSEHLYRLYCSFELKAVAIDK